MLFRAAIKHWWYSQSASQCQTHCLAKSNAAQFFSIGFTIFNKKYFYLNFLKYFLWNLVNYFLMSKGSVLVPARSVNDWEERQPPPRPPAGGQHTNTNISSQFKWNIFRNSIIFTIKMWNIFTIKSKILWNT